MSREIRSFDYVNHPYDLVRAELRSNAAGVLRSATSAASHRAEAVAAGLRVQVAGLEVSTAIDVTIGDATEGEGGPGGTRMLQIPIRWKAAERPGLFPRMSAKLAVYPLTSTETQLDFHGEYEPPLGPLGSAIDAAIGHRIAEASVHRFLREVADYLRTSLPGTPG